MLRFTVALVSLLLLLPTISAAQVSLPAMDPVIEGLVDSVSADTLRNYLMSMQGFFTRHTNSDTLSATVGIGAARRWVFDQFVQISNDNGGILQVEYHEFTETIQGVTKLHKNVVATLPGSDPAQADRIYILSGHLDSRNEDNMDWTGFAPGAVDDGGGSAAAIECARVLAKMGTEATIKFVNVVGEDQGLFGSSALALDAFQQGWNIEGMMTNDVFGNTVFGEVGVGDSLDNDTVNVRTFSIGPSNSSSRNMSRMVKLYGDAYTTQNVNIIPMQDRPGRGGDHIPFNDNGFTACRLMDQFDNLIHQHSPADSFGVMNFPYLARNVGIDVAMFGNLANAPRPVVDFVVGNTGDSTGFQLSWSPSDATDLGGYIVTIRGTGSTFWDQTIDVGNTLSHLFTPSPSESLWLGVAAYDTLGHMGLVTEERGVLSTIPFAPTGLLVAPTNSTIDLAWNGAPEGDFSHHNVFRSLSAAGPFNQINGSPITVPAFTDAAVLPVTFYYYAVSTVDTNGNEGPQSGIERGRVASLDQGVLFVEETVVGPGQPHRPTEAESDSFYAVVFDTIPHTVLDYDSAAAATGINVSDLGAYSSVVWVSDDRNLTVSGVLLQNQFLVENLAALRQYLDLGGNVLVMGWKLADGISPLYPVAFGPGDVLHDYFRVETVNFASPDGGKFSYGATGLLGYPTVQIDSSKARNPWKGKLPDMDFFLSVAPGGETVYTFNSDPPDSSFHGSPSGIRYDGGTYRTQFFDFPLYHLQEQNAQDLIGKALTWFGDIPTSVAQSPEEESAPITRLSIRATPNPFGRTGTTFHYALPGKATVELAIFSPSGRRVRLLKKASQSGGQHSVVWDGRDESGRTAAAGVYFYRITAGKSRATGKVVLVR